MGAVFAERFNRIIWDLLEKPVFEQGVGNWIDLLSTITKQYNNRIHSSTKLTPTGASLEDNEGYVYKSLIDKPEKTKPEFQINDLVRTGGLRKTFSEGDKTKWSYKLYRIAAKVIDTLPGYRTNNLHQWRYNEALLKKTEFSVKEIDNFMKKLNIT